jgi:hypothetical protein
LIRPYEAGIAFLVLVIRRGQRLPARAYVL